MNVSEGGNQISSCKLTDLSVVVAWSSVLRRVLRQSPGSVGSNGVTSPGTERAGSPVRSHPQTSSSPRGVRGRKTEVQGEASSVQSCVSVCDRGRTQGNAPSCVLGENSNSIPEQPAPGLCLLAEFLKNRSSSQAVMEALGAPGAFQKSEDKRWESLFDQLTRETVSEELRTCVPQAHLCRLSLPPSSLSASGDLTARRCPDSPALFGFRLETLMWVQLLCSWRPVLSSRSSAPCRGFLSSLTRANPTEEEGDRDPPHAPECRR